MVEEAWVFSPLSCSLSMDDVEMVTASKKGGAVVEAVTARAKATRTR